MNIVIWLHQIKWFVRMIEWNSCSINTWNWFYGENEKNCAARIFDERVLYDTKINKPINYLFKAYAKSSDNKNKSHEINQVSSKNKSQQVHEIRKREQEWEEERKSVAFDVIQTNWNEFIPVAHPLCHKNSKNQNCHANGNKTSVELSWKCMTIQLQMDLRDAIFLSWWFSTYFCCWNISGFKSWSSLTPN